MTDDGETDQQELQAYINSPAVTGNEQFTVNFACAQESTLNMVLRLNSKEKFAQEGAYKMADPWCEDPTALPGPTGSGRKELQFAYDAESEQSISNHCFPVTSETNSFSAGFAIPMYTTKGKSRVAESVA